MCEKDLISRQAAIDALCDNCDNVQAVCPHYPCKQYTAIDALPSAQTTQSNTSNALTALDCISRRAAIDAIYKCTDIYVNNLPVMIDKADAYKALADLPSAQPEIIRCKDCKHYNAGFECLIDGYGIERDKDWYCADAERREE